MQLRSLVAALALTTSLAAGCAGSQRAGQTNAAPIGVKPPARSIDRAAVRAKLAERRKVTVARFLAYREGRVYPINTGDRTQHLWIDPWGNLCAAATIISGDWGRDATIQAVGGNLTVRLADVRSGELNDWILTSGLTHHELVAIQVPGSPVLGGGEEAPRLVPDPEQQRETERLYAIYLDVERQLSSMWDESLDDAVDRLMTHPALARELLANRVAMPATPIPPPDAVVALPTPPPA